MTQKLVLVNMSNWEIDGYQVTGLNSGDAICPDKGDGVLLKPGESIEITPLTLNKRIQLTAEPVDVEGAEPGFKRQIVTLDNDPASSE